MAEPGGETKTSGGASAAPELPVASAGTPTVFISYASQDAAVAGALVEALERHGVGCWIAPRDVKAGALYADAIARAISGAKAFVLVLSESAIASSHVGKEIERASSKRRPIIALRIDAAPLTPALEYFLSESQWVEAQTTGSMQAAYAKLIDDIRDPGRTAARNTPAAPLEVSAATARAAHPKLRFNWILLAAGTVFVAALAALLVDKFWISSHVAQEKPVATTSLAPAAGAPAQPTISEKSIAVLPFVDMSEKKDQEYFADGLSEELIDMLTKIPELRVPARTSSFYFKGKQATVHDIAKALSVAHVLEGSVRKSGRHLRITAQLVRADNGYHLWSETYDRQLDDIFKVQDEIAGAVVKALKVRLSSPRVPGWATRTKSPDAYNEYLIGMQFYNRISADAFRHAIAAFRKAIRIDPNFAPAYASLAMSEAFLVMAGRGDTAALRQAEEHANRAILLAPDLVDGYLARAYLRSGSLLDIGGAQQDIERALAIDPTDSRVQRRRGDVLRALGHLPEAIAAERRAIELDPLSALAWDYLAKTLLVAGQYDEARKAFRRDVEISPEAAEEIRPDLALMELLDGRPAAAHDQFRQLRDEDDRLFGSVLAEHALGHKAEAEKALGRFLAKYGRDQPYTVASLFSWRNERDQAFIWLDRALEQRDGSLAAVTFDPLLNNLRGDPRYTVFLRKMKLPE
jgi:TolB-like protein/Tfp pilus assembly protein PilF